MLLLQSECAAVLISGLNNWLDQVLTGKLSSAFEDLTKQGRSGRLKEQMYLMSD